MALAPGKRLGPYEILAPLGAGGMGEVYRARDTRLDRTVAIKVLPQHLSADPHLQKRFEREAKAISSLNHPHICALYDVGRQDGTDYLVMEFLEGETLGARLARGALPLAELLRNAAQIADALDKAHRHGVVHRDLKPGNIMLTKAGVKLLDFGLAKRAGLGGAAADAATAATAATAGQPITSEGTIVGTYQYMAPEQLEGKEADARGDIFAFGAVLYEMATGKRAFEGATQASLIAAILKEEPRPLSTLAPMTPPALDRLVRTCLAKDPDERYQSAHDILLELKWIAEAGSQAGLTAPVVAHRNVHERLAWATAAAILTLTAIALAIGYVWRAPKPIQPMRLSAEIGADVSLETSSGPAVIFSPDATRLALLAHSADQQVCLYVRGLDQLQAVPLPGTEGAQNPFFSPDGQWIGFFANGKLKKVSAQGGTTAVTLCDAGIRASGSWSEDGTIVFAMRDNSGLFKVSSAGGTPEPLTTLDQQAGEVTQRWPQVLPGGRTILFTSGTTTSDQDADFVVYSPADKQRKTLHRRGFYPRYLPSGHLLYVNEGTLFAVTFDLQRLEITGPATPILEGVVANPATGGAQFSFSETGIFTYVASSGRNLSINWMDRVGKFTPLREAPGQYSTPMFSPDGKRLALHVGDSKRADIWVHDWERDTATRLTFTGEAIRFPVWTPDGQRITYSAREKDGSFGLFWIRADGGGDPQRLTNNKNLQVPTSWSPEGKVLAFHQYNPETYTDIMILSVEGNEISGWKPGEPKPFHNSTSNDWRAAFSPDGRWLAYTSGEAGNNEVYVRPFPGPGAKWLISSGGGEVPTWSQNGRELFYRNQKTIMVVGYTASGDTFRPAKPQPWSPGQVVGPMGARNFNLHPDGKRFAVLMPAHGKEAAKADKVVIIFNFFEELRRKVPTSAK